MAVRKIDKFPAEERSVTDEPLEVVEYNGERFVKVRRTETTITWERVDELRERRTVLLREKVEAPAQTDEEISKTEAILDGVGLPLDKPKTDEARVR